ncbi:DMT family transporter [Parachitinimonas caeni]|uniref:EamA family transporter n=1 Tax=Parachitinimonas caeni TaxID=3031301 RepID=A0ABT7DV00_9NEIS|nr:EamA family transporter [Parachitinimonas caeni]MDK2122472.1 EamA family transporter [Parachitinimonas caeni]
MPTSLAYPAVVFIWSTTALAISWSVGGMSFMSALVGRMALGTLFAVLALFLLGRSFPMGRAAWRNYLIAGGAMVSSMLCTYWAAQSVSSGLIAVLYGLSPLVTALLASLIVGERPGRGELVGIGLALLGLWLIFSGRLSIGHGGVLAILAVLAGVVLQALGAVLTKKYGSEVPPMATAAGALLVSAVGSGLVWLLFDRQLPQAVSARGIWAVVYLASVGSVLAMSLYFLLIQRLPTSHVALITLITPVTALWLGHVLNGESVEPHVWQGSLVILAGLAVHQLPLWLKRRR